MANILNVWDNANQRYMPIPVLKGDRGISGCFPLLQIAYAPSVTVPVNTECEISALEGAISVSLGQAEDGYASEWAFMITQGDTAYDVVLPTVEWSNGFAPAFLSNTTTEVRLHYKGETLEGVYN